MLMCCERAASGLGTSSITMYAASPAISLAASHHSPDLLCHCSVTPARHQASSPHSLAHAAGCLTSPNVVHAAVGLIASIVFVAMSLCLSLADGTDMNPLSKNFFASSESRWLWRRAMVKNILVILPALLPNFHRFVVRPCACGKWRNSSAFAT